MDYQPFSSGKFLGMRMYRGVKSVDDQPLTLAHLGQIDQTDHDHVTG